MTANEFSSRIESSEKKLYIAAFSITKNAEDAKDAVGNAILKAWQNHEALRDDDKFDAWILKITYNEAKKLKTKSNMYTNIDELYDSFSDTADQSDIEFFDILANAGLDTRTRKIITLCFFYGYNLEEIASMLSVPLSTVKSSYYRGLRKIADKEGGK